MADALPQSVRAGLDDPFRELAGPLAGTRKLDLTVADFGLLTPRLKQVVLTSPDLAHFRYSPGQDVMLLVGSDGKRPVRRRYTIRSFDPDRRLLTLLIVLHGDGPGERWVLGARPGDRIEGIGPRGKISPSPAAAWHMFFGDESAIAAIFAMTEALPGDAVATLVLEVEGSAEELELLAPARTRLSWLHRLGRPAGDPALLAAEAAEVELPTGAGHAYVFGEARVVLAVREVLAGRGLGPDQVSAKAYWGRGRANAGHGEPGRD